MPNCEDEEYWARVFTLSDFGIQKEEQFIIKSGQVAISNSYDGAQIGLNIYSIDSNFPDSTPAFIGGGITYAPEIGDTPEIIQIEFYASIVIPANIERILVVAAQGSDTYNPDYKKVLIAGTEEDNGISWFSGCRQYYKYTPTTDLTNPVPDANFYINVTGETFNSVNTGPDTTLTHNLDDPPIWMNQYACSGGGLKFSRAFNLKDFGIEINEEFVINRGQVAFSAVGVHDVKIQFNIYKIDSNFPDSFSSANLIGSSQVVDLPYFGTGNPPRIFNVDFDTPVVVPSNVEMVLVEVYNLPRPGHSSTAFIAGTKEFTGLSWLKSEAGGCPPECYTSTVDMGKPEVNFYVKVSGDVNPVANNFGISVTSICSGLLKKFSVEDKSKVATVVWNFGDPGSGANNSSTETSPAHDFSNAGQYTITATVTDLNGNIEVLTETVDVNPPSAFAIGDIYACEDSFNTGFSTSFDTSAIEQQVLGGQLDRRVTFIDGSGNKYYYLPNPFSNTIKDRETVTVRVADAGNSCCFSETTFDLIVTPLPELQDIGDILECESDSEGYATFNLSNIQSDLKNNFPNASIDFFHENGTIINSLIVQNGVIDEELITVRLTESGTSCSNEATFKLIVNPLPIANPLPEIFGCDDDGDGISEYFDFFNVEGTVLGNQTGMIVSYYDATGNELHIPSNNLFANTIPFQETVIVRVTNPQTTCYAETDLVLKTSSKPSINKPQDIYACDEGDGVSSFDLSDIEKIIIGNQDNLNVFYYTSNGTDITDLMSSDYINNEPWAETINVRVENALSSKCFTETSFNLYVNSLPELSLEESYFLCNLEPNMAISANSSFSSWEWTFEDGSVISNNSSAVLVNAGTYRLNVTEEKNGILCENVIQFELVRSVLPQITDVKYQELSDNNFVEIKVTGDGEFEYSIDGTSYQNSNLFENLLGGVYTVYVRDKKGCGEDSKEVTLIDYPKYFTPNGDGNNDIWQIKGIANYPNAKIMIYDRYGKLLKQISTNANQGWDGTFNGKEMESTDYWFTANLGNKNFIGHFTLKR